MAKRFVVRFFTFVALILPSSLLMALLAAPARPQPLELPGCARVLADSSASMTAMQARLSRVRGAEACAVTRLYFLELVKERAAVAQCKIGPERDQDLDRIDADVERLNQAIAGACG